MGIGFLGATSTVASSKCLVTCGKAKVLADCGLFQGYRQLRVRSRDDMPFGLDELPSVQDPTAPRLPSSRRRSYANRQAH